MKNTVVKTGISVAISVLLCAQASASSVDTTGEKNNELIGLGSGVLVGTAVAGPLGGMVAGIFGLLIADDVNSDKKLAASRHLIAQKQQALFVLQQQVDEADARAAILMATLDKTLDQANPDIVTSIQFKTASSELEQHYKSELDLLAASLRQNPKLTVKLSGYADQRGDSEFNQVLSEQRALTVKNYLLSQGVAEKQLISHAYGESQLVSRGTEVEDNFFDRRVSLTVSDDINIMTAAQP
ncbi:MAG: sortase-associated OmpA-like protein PdsO [Paraglaciecola sp.]|nr:sortase-associated OmpA-like protein PdsO [Paraglaciecola sp.]